MRRCCWFAKRRRWFESSLIIFIIDQCAPSRRRLSSVAAQSIDQGVINPYHTRLSTLTHHQGRRETHYRFVLAADWYLQIRQPLRIRMECDSPGLQGCKHAGVFPNIIADGAQLLANSRIVLASRTQFCVQHVVLNFQLNALGRSIQLDYSRGSIEMKVDARGDHVTKNRRRLPFGLAAPDEQPQAEDEFYDLTLLLHLGMHTEKLCVDRLDAATALILLGPNLPICTIPVVGRGDLWIIIEASLHY